MKIDRMEVYSVALPLIYPWKTAYGEDADSHSVLVRMFCGDHGSWRGNNPSSTRIIYKVKLQLHTWDKDKGTGIHNGGYSNPEFDRAVDEAAQIIDRAKGEKGLQAQSNSVVQKTWKGFSLVFWKKSYERRTR